MKKIVFAILLIVIICVLAGCAQAPTGSKMLMEDQFIVIEETNGGLSGESTKYIYDRDTKIVYLYTFAGYHASMCPYYVIVDGVPQVAIYGETYR